MDPDEYEEIANEYVGVRQAINRLEWRASLHPGDPDALDEDEWERLEELKNWEP